MPPSSTGWLTRTLLGTLTTGALAVTAPAAADEPSCARFRQDPLVYFYERRQADAVRCSEAILESPDEPLAVRVQTLQALACIYSALPEPALAHAALLQILSLDPRADLDRPERLPPPVVRAFYALRDSALLASGGASDPRLDVRTIAIGEIENASVVPHRGIDFDKFARGMTHLVMSDLFAVSDLRIVDRQRLNALRKEIEMTQNDAIFDPGTRVAFGRLTGAQSFLFGTLFHEGGGKLRIDLRVVNTSTSDVLVAGSITGKIDDSKDVLEMEEKLVLETIAPKLDEMLRSAGAGKADATGALEPFLESKKKRFESGGASYIDFLTRSGEAVLAEDRGDLAAAARAWNEVLALDPENGFALSRARALAAYAGYGTREAE